MKKLFMAMILLPVMMLSFISNQNFTVSGTIKDSKGNPIPFATVILKGTKTGVAADDKGNYSIVVNDENGTLVFAIVGYDAKEIKINKQKLIHAVLNAKVSQLNEVVVTGIAQGIAPGLMVRRTKSEVRRDAAVDESVLNGWPPSGYENLNDDGNDREGYSNIVENDFRKVTDDPLSTFSIDVDGASYSNVRRYLNDRQLPPAGAVRTEEMINYFRYNYPFPTGKDPFSITTELSNCPWNKDNKLVMIGLQGKEIPVQGLPASNLVFLIDVSGSMNQENKLPLIKSSLEMLTDQLREKDKISIVVYAGNAGLVLPATNGFQKQKIKDAINNLEAGGSTAGGAGIKLAYKIAAENMVSKGNNRVILCTDGDFNVGTSSDDDMVLIEKERESGIYLTVLGYGTGNYQDNKMQLLADKGNGNHAYIDGINEAKKVLVNEFGATLFTIAKDVKLQVEFNPAKVAGYRLIGYENRLLNKEDFNDDKKDAGELGSGHTVTALYEIIPAGVKSEFLTPVDPLKYQQQHTTNTTAGSTNEILTVKFRYKNPDSKKSELIVHPVNENNISFDQTSDNFHWAVSVASFGMLLRNSRFKGTSSYNNVLQYCNTSPGNDKEGYRKEFITLVKTAGDLSKKEKESGTGTK